MPLPFCDVPIMGSLIKSQNSFNKLLHRQVYPVLFVIDDS